MKNHITLAIEKNIDLIDINPLKFLKKYKDSPSICTELANTLLDAGIEIIDPETQENILTQDSIYLFDSEDRYNWVQLFNSNYEVGTDPDASCDQISNAINNIGGKFIQTPNLDRRSPYGDRIGDLHAEQLWIEIDEFVPDNELDIFVTADVHDVSYQYWKLTIDIGKHVATMYPVLGVTVVNAESLIKELDIVLDKIVRKL